MKKRIKVLTALLCTAALLAGCGGASGDSGTESAAEDTQKKADSEGTEAESEEVSEVTLAFLVREIPLTRVRDSAIRALLCIQIW